MTTRTKKKATPTSLKPATPAGKKDQATLPNAWTKKEKGSPRKGPNPVTPAATDPEVVTVPMTENTQSVTDATDTAMGMGPHSRSPPAMTPCDSSLSKWLKDASNMPPAPPSKPPPPESKPKATQPTTPPAKQQVLKKAEAPAKENLSEQISDGAESGRDQPEPSPESPPPLLKACGRSQIIASPPSGHT